jgi:vitamin B12 transporter
MRQILLVAGILGGGLPVLAQSVPAPPAAPPSYQESIVVTASVEGEERSDLPASVSVIPAEEIAAVQATQLIELLELVPGLHVVQAGGPGQLATVFTRGAESDQTLVLWNGIPLNDPYLGGFYDWAFLPVEGVERVEVVRGPFSSLYGSDALGGVVQLISSHRDGGSVRLEGGGDGYGRAGFSLGRTLGSLRLDLDGHLRRGEGELPNSGYDGEEAALRAEWQPRRGLTVGLLGRANDSERGVPFFDRQTPSPGQRYLWDSQEVAVPVSWLQGPWQLEGRLARTATDAVNLGGAFAQRAETSASVLRGRAAGTYELAPGRSEGGAAGGSGGWLALGADWDRQEAASADDFGRSLDGETRRNWAAFTQLSWKWQRVSLDLGVRHDDNEFYGSETSPRAGMVVALGGDGGDGAGGGATRLRASYGEGFRAPSLFDVFHPIFGNPEVRPETSTSLELGIEHRAAVWGASLVAFETRQDDRIDFDPVTFQSVNAGRARSRGLEGEVELRRGIWNARLDATRLEAEDRDTGRPLLRRPETTASLLVRLAPAPAWSLYTVGRYVGERPDIDDVFPFGRVTAPDYLTFDLGGRWQARTWIAPYARVENLADEQYQDPFGYPHPGRTWVGGLAVTW